MIKLPDGTKAYTLQETAKMLDVSRRSITNYISSGALEYITIGNRCRYVTEQYLNNFIERGKSQKNG